MVRSVAGFKASDSHTHIKLNAFMKSKGILTAAISKLMGAIHKNVARLAPSQVYETPHGIEDLKCLRTNFSIYVCLVTFKIQSSNYSQNGNSPPATVCRTGRTVV